MSPRRTPGSRRLLSGPLVAAAFVGSVHAAFSAYWALGGRFLLRTVGPWAVELARERPTAASATLLLVAAVKVAAAVVPVLLVAGRIPGAQRWRLLCLVGGGLLAAYGGLNAIVAWLVLAGAISTEAGFDRPAMLGHAFLWDPLFLVWGVLMVVGLRGAGARTRPRSVADRR